MLEQSLDYTRMDNAGESMRPRGPGPAYRKEQFTIPCQGGSLLSLSELGLVAGVRSARMEPVSVFGTVRECLLDHSHALTHGQRNGPSRIQVDRGTLEVLPGHNTSSVQQAGCPVGHGEPSVPGRWDVQAAMLAARPKFGLWILPWRIACLPWGWC